MRQISLTELQQMAENARQTIWDKAGAQGREPKIYLHWTGMHYGQLYDDYHVNIDRDGETYVSTENLAGTLPHTWRRNTGSIGVTLCCAFGAGGSNLGDEPPTAKQIEMMAQVIAALADALWLTIDKNHVLTHGEAANNEDGDCNYHEPYAWWNDSYGDGNTRGDLEYLGTGESPRYNPWATDGSRGGDVLRGKANWYLSQWKK